MAAVNGVRAVTATLAAATADTVTLSGKPRQVEICNHNATAIIYFRLDGTTAVSAAAENYPVLPLERVRVGLGESGQVSLISAGTPTYSVIGLL